jgi:hypothetical protein
LTARGEDGDPLFKLAAEKFHAALKINPRDTRALFYWGSI